MFYLLVFFFPIMLKNLTLSIWAHFSLPIHFRIQLKILLFLNPSVVLHHPISLSYFIHTPPTICSGQLNNCFWWCPEHLVSKGDGAFAVAGHRLWNNLPLVPHPWLFLNMLLLLLLLCPCLFLIVLFWNLVVQEPFIQHCMQVSCASWYNLKWMGFQCVQACGAAGRGAVVTFHTHKRGSVRCMKWRKMADHVQVSRGFMFL